LARAAFSPPPDGKTEPGRATWRFDDAELLVNKVFTEAASTHCRKAILSYVRHWSAAGFVADLDENGGIRRVNAVHDRGLFP